jgi:adenylate cyclase
MGETHDAIPARLARGEDIDVVIRVGDALNEVIDLYERALALDPQDEPAMVGLAIALSDRVSVLWSEDPAGDIARADKAADGALALQPDDSWAHYAMALVFYAKRQWGAAIAQAEAAIADDPNNASAHAVASFWKMLLGHSEEGFAGVETALRLSPRDPAEVLGLVCCAPAGPNCMSAA